MSLYNTPSKKGSKRKSRELDIPNWVRQNAYCVEDTTYSQELTSNDFFPLPIGRQNAYYNQPSYCEDSKLKIRKGGTKDSKDPECQPYDISCLSSPLFASPSVLSRQSAYCGKQNEEDAAAYFSPFPLDDTSEDNLFEEKIGSSIENIYEHIDIFGDIEDVGDFTSLDKLLESWLSKMDENVTSLDV
jgi:hypothetical protein